ncbi:3'(2'),5'-bisphosphate nucleotidase [Blastopirellula marina]|uniref:3'(2'),5'-bisphosphate nucleotidase n=1 Tax=Blastopirellula marina TaxID=124 RepID=A0A2S8EZC2_9BACT|nr:MULTISPECIES: 3'(2'),5'-bisphosphate nucleotidase [Pirellulaceae]PQO25221.1 3'(2'),5'-bisphosphate nucleotidase [Blastopirellula marina]RCS41654.1 3'(2'),5'-bisphosphate nucleotidase [Bremerella cremea]
MADSQYTQELRVAVQAVVEASKICRHIQSTEDFVELSKNDRSPVTVADFGSQAVVCKAISEAFPDDPMIAEEDSAALRLPDQVSVLNRVVKEVAKVVPDATQEQVLSWIDQGISRDPAPRTWTLDPIDGTKGFLRNEQYAIALALLIDGQVKVAALACPNLGTIESDEIGYLFTAIRGEGAYVSPLSDPTDRTRISTSGCIIGRDARFCESVESGHSDHSWSSEIATELGITRDSVRLDSQAKYAVVARGEAEIYLRLPTQAGYVEKIWDHAAGSLVIEEAGGTVTDIHGHPLDFSRGALLSENQGIIATNGALHAAVEAAMKKASAG